MENPESIEIKLHCEKEGEVSWKAEIVNEEAVEYTQERKKECVRELGGRIIEGIIRLPIRGKILVIMQVVQVCDT